MLIIVKDTDIFILCRHSIVTEYWGDVISRDSHNSNQTHGINWPGKGKHNAGLGLAMDAEHMANAFVYDKSTNTHLPGMKHQKPTWDKEEKKQKWSTWYGPEVDKDSIFMHCGLGGFANGISAQMPLDQDDVEVNCKICHFIEDLITQDGKTHQIMRSFLVAIRDIEPGEEIIWNYVV